MVQAGLIKHIRHLHKEDIKVIIGDNLAAHLSLYVTMLCELHNVRFCFLPENSTHLLQPLDVAVFGPMKRHWRKILSDWKDECMKTGQNSATLPKQVFPTLLKKLMEKRLQRSHPERFRVLWALTSESQERPGQAAQGKQGGGDPGSAAAVGEAVLHAI
jgi:hypothetical protein